MDPEPWDGILDAYVEGNRSLSISTTSDEIVGDEDCLYLNVFTREVSTCEFSPKLVFLLSYIDTSLK